MKIYEHSNPDFGKAFKRISKAFKTHFPNVEWVSSNADVEIVQVVGKAEYDYLVNKNSLSNVVIQQQCLFTTGISLEKWVELWKQCKLIISFHDCKAYTEGKINFFMSPLGAEPDLFPIGTQPRFYSIFSTGHVAETECLDKIFDACVCANRKMIHTGENFKWDNNHYQFLGYMEDPWFASLLQKVKYVSGLRRTEGFEMHCIEGAMTGAVPIIPFIQTYGYYKDFGIFIDMNKDITQQLINILLSDYKPLSLEQINYVRDRFSWKRICNDIYNRIIHD